MHASTNVSNTCQARLRVRAMRVDTHNTDANGLRVDSRGTAIADEASHCGEQPETPATERTPGQQANQRQQESLQKELRAAEARRFRREHPACRRLTLGTFIRIFHR